MTRLVAVVAEPLDVSAVLGAVADPSAGGVALFQGVVRDVDHGQQVARLEYVAHPTAQAEMERVCDEVASEFGAVHVAAVHREGHLEIGDLAVLVAASAAHRDVAFAAARALIDRVKAEVPIWKRQTFVDGTEEWVGACD